MRKLILVVALICIAFVAGTRVGSSHGDSNSNSYAYGYGNSDDNGYGGGSDNGSLVGRVGYYINNIVVGISSIANMKQTFQHVQDTINNAHGG